MKDRSKGTEMNTSHFNYVLFIPSDAQMPFPPVFCPSERAIDKQTIKARPSAAVNNSEWHVGRSAGYIDNY